jgi:hypothetical protein
MADGSMEREGEAAEGRMAGSSWVCVYVRIDSAKFYLYPKWILRGYLVIKY